MHLMEYFLGLNFLPLHHTKWAFHCDFVRSWLPSLLKGRDGQIDRPLPPMTWTSTAMPLKPMTKKQVGGTALGTEDLRNPGGFTESLPGVCISTASFWVSSMCSLECHPSQSCIGDKGRAVQKKSVDQVEMIPQIHQSIYREGPRVPKPGHKCVQLVVETKHQKIHM